MRLKSLAILAAASLVFGSTAASAQSAQALSLPGNGDIVRAAAPVEGASELRGRYAWLLYLLGAAAIIAAIIIIADDNNGPTSP